VANNTVSANNGHGVRLYSSGDNVLLNNTLENNSVSLGGFSVTHWRQTMPVSNTVNGRPVGYFWNVTGGVIDASQYGEVILANCTSMTVKDGVFYNISLSIELGFSRTITVTNNTVLFGKNGFVLLHSRDNALTNNTISHSEWNSIGIYYSCDNNTVSDNAILGSEQCAIRTWFSSYNTLANNTISDCDQFGMLFFSASDNTLLDNTFESSGVTLDGTVATHWRQTIAFNNSVNGLPVGYFWNLTGGEIDGSQYGQVILANSTGVTLRDGIFRNVPIGIQLGFSDDNTLTNNTMSENSVHGLELETSYRNMITNNAALNNAVYGMYLHLSQNNTLANNTVSGNTEQGIYVYFSSDNALIDNTITRNGLDGVCLGSVTSNNVLTKNTIGLNNGTGVTNYGQSNLLYLNTFDSNVEGNALDNGFDNQWNTTGVGNYWSDYNGTGTYKIPGTAGSIDYHPQEIPDEDAPLIDHPSDIEYAEGTTGHVITWSPSDAHPATYELYRNGTLVGSGTWASGEIMVSVDGFNVGTYNYTLVANDEAGHSTSDTVFVTVTPASTTSSTTTTTTTTGTTTTTSTTTGTTTTTGGTTTGGGIPQDILIIILLGGAAVVVVVILVIFMVKRR